MPFSDVIAKYRTLYPDIGKMEKPHLHEFLQLIVNELEKRSWGTYAGEITDNASLISRESGTHNKKGIDALKFHFHCMSDFVKFHAKLTSERFNRDVGNNGVFSLWGSQDEVDYFGKHEQCSSGKLCDMCELLAFLGDQRPKRAATLAARIQRHDGGAFKANINDFREFTVKGRWRDEKVVALIVEGPLELLRWWTYNKHARREQGVPPCVIPVKGNSGLEEATPQPPSMAKTGLEETTPQPPSITETGFEKAAQEPLSKAKWSDLEEITPHALRMSPNSGHWEIAPNSLSMAASGLWEATPQAAKSGRGEATSLPLDLAVTGLEKATPQALSMPKSGLEEITPKTPSTTETDPLGRIEVHLICCHDIGRTGREHVEGDGECWEVLRPVAVCV
ncbi:hypothetical protein LTR37_016255 [Vermiconidia calcicola]|uniref:Uncharacterized protein n=1 Tax=Vermiconidia calcicola TaxID=1690605 RepID=A0ACC3MNF4_9PEZI|nr:hypothetical protein LTR37_016255 [Vermiconidia calcicola]